MASDIHSHQTAIRGLDSRAGLEEFLSRHGPIHARILGDWLPSDRNARIVEVASGPGWLLEWLKRRGYADVSGCDLSPSQVAVAQSLGAPVVEADAATHLDAQPPGSVAAVMALDFLEHIPRNAVSTFLRACLRALRPGGCLILRLPNGSSPLAGLNLFNDSTHVWTYTPVCLGSLLTFEGFSELAFRDESAASICRLRVLRVPIARLFQLAIRAAIKLAVNESVRFLGSSLWCRAVKDPARAQP